MALKIVPLELAEANAVILSWHRHHKETVGHRFSLGCVDTQTCTIVGAIVVGRPVARLISLNTVEVTRLVTDGTKNACSFLYSAAARAAREMGYEKIQTYIMDTETGHSLVASGWECESVDIGGGQWKHTDGKPRRTDQPTCKKQRWVKVLNTAIPEYRLPKPTTEKQMSIFDIMGEGSNE